MLAANTRPQPDLYPVKALGHGLGSKGLEGSYEDHSMRMQNKVCGSCWPSALDFVGEDRSDAQNMPIYRISE